jgi:hypothetical protein
MTGKGHQTSAGRPVEVCMEAGVFMVAVEAVAEGAAYMVEEGVCMVDRVCSRREATL